MHLFDIDHARRAEVMADELGQQRLVAYAKHLQSIALWWSGQAAEAVELATEAVEAFAETDRLFEWCEARKFLGVALVFHGEPELGLTIQRDVLAVVRGRLPNAFNVAHNLSYLGHCHRMLGDDTAALADWTEARELCQLVGNRGTAIHVSIGLAEIAADRGDHAVSLARAGEALDLARAARARTYEPWAWTVAMRAHAISGDRYSAIACARRAAEHLGAVPPGETVRLAVELAHVASDAGEVAAAARLLGVAVASHDRRELPFPAPAELERRAAVEQTLARQLGTAAAEHVEAGRRCTVAEAAGELLVA